MGCCCSTNGEDIYEDGETGDKTNLLGNPVGESTRTASIDHNNARQSQSLDQGDEQAKLNSILQKTANSYIDVPALNSPMEQPNYVAWENNYGDKIRDVLKRHQCIQTSVSLLADIPQLERTLGGDPLPAVDRKMVTDSSCGIIDAMQNIKIYHSENIIIPFNGSNL